MSEHCENCAPEFTECWNDKSRCRKQPSSLAAPAGSVANRGYMHERTKHNPTEKAFADKWEEENQERPGINFGNGILQDLFMKGGHFWPQCTHEVTPSERYVAATAIQWLGSNCGMSFLECVLNRSGYRIVKQDKPQNDQALP